MKQTEIGMIPDDWEVKELESLCSLITKQTGFDYSATIKPALVTEIQENTISFIQNKDFAGEKINYETDFYIPLRVAKKFPRIFLDSDVLLISISGRIGNVAHFKHRKDAFIGGAVGIARFLNNDNINYSMRYLLSDSGQKQIFSNQKSGAQHNLTIADVRKLKIPFPPTLAEQQKIAKALSDVDNVISTLEKLITKKKNLKQGTMQQLLTGKKRLPGFGPAVVEPVETPATKQTELGEIPADWEVVNIQDILITTKDKLKIGPFGSQLKKEYLLENGQYKVFGQENVYLNDFEYCYRFLTKEHFQNLQSCELKEGDFVISTMGTIGKCAIVPKKAGVGIMDSHLVRLRLNQNIDKEYFKYYFQSDIIQNQIAALSVGGIMDGLSTSIIKKLKVIKFSISEQTAIANVLSSMDKEIEALEAKLGKYRNLKTGMMQQLLTGKIRLR